MISWNPDYVAQQAAPGESQVVDDIEVLEITEDGTPDGRGRSIWFWLAEGKRYRVLLNRISLFGEFELEFRLSP